MTSASNQDIPRTVAASQGWRWVVEGFRLYRKNPPLLSTAFGMMFGLLMALNLIPGIGGILSSLASPLMVAGFMAAFRALDNDESLELPHFLAGVKRPLLAAPAVPLVALGAVQLLATLVIGQIMQGMGFDAEAFAKLAQNENASLAELQAFKNQTLPAILAGLLLFTPLIMATWFAPALILFGGANLGTALGVSFRAVLKNWAAMLVNSLALSGVLLLLVLMSVYLGTLVFTVMLLILLLVAPPLLQASLYASYQAIFAVWADEAGRQAADKLA
jgi:hypothetical protein